VSERDLMAHWKH